VPDAVVLGAGLTSGMTLDRPVLRRIRGELRRADALRAAFRALERSDISSRRLEERLERAADRPTARDVAASLRRSGLLDDERTARIRARRLAERGWGDAAILVRLEAEGIGEADARAAVAELEPERLRADGVPATRLAARGFSPETIEDVVGPLD
jgi:SOS response regulatory protein OraA/RecX